MASAMRKVAVYLGLVEDDHRYGDPYPADYVDGDDYADYVAEYTEPPEPGDGQPAYATDGGSAARATADRRAQAVDHIQATDLARITTLHPRTYNEARTIGEHF